MGAGRGLLWFVFYLYSIQYKINIQLLSGSYHPHFDHPKGSSRIVEQKGRARTRARGCRPGAGLSARSSSHHQPPPISIPAQTDRGATNSTEICCLAAQQYQPLFCLESSASQKPPTRQRSQHSCTPCFPALCSSSLSLRRWLVLSFMSDS